MYESQAVTLKQVIHFRGKKLIFRRNPSNKSFTLHSQVIVVTCGKSEWVKTTIDWFGVMTSHIGAIHASKRTLELSSRTSPLRWSDRGVGRALWRSSPSTFHRARDHTVRPDVVLCSAGADAFGAGGRWEDACRPSREVAVRAVRAVGGG